MVTALAPRTWHAWPAPQAAADAGPSGLPGRECDLAEYWASPALSPASCSNTSFTSKFMMLMALKEMAIWGAPASAPCRCTSSRFPYTGCAFWTSCPQDSCPGPPATAVHVGAHPPALPDGLYYYYCCWLILFSFIFISWRLITLQYCSGFCHTLT